MGLDRDTRRVTGDRQSLRKCYFFHCCLGKSVAGGKFGVKNLMSELGNWVSFEVKCCYRFSVVMVSLRNMKHFSRKATHAHITPNIGKCSYCSNERHFIQRSVKTSDKRGSGATSFLATWFVPLSFTGVIFRRSNPIVQVYGRYWLRVRNKTTDWNQLGEGQSINYKLS